MAWLLQKSLFRIHPAGSLSAFIFKMLGSGDGVGAPNFPPHDLVAIGDKYDEFAV